MRTSSRRALVLGLLLVQSGCLVMKKDHDDAIAKLTSEEGKTAAALAATKSDLEATRQRLDNALRANADASSDTMTNKQRLNELAGRLDEQNHHMEELRKDLGATRTEIYARLDELKRTQPPPTPPAPPPPAIPADQATHWKQLSEAYGKKDWLLVRALAPEYVNRHPTDDKADDALYFAADADLSEGRPSSALGNFNRLLKLFPRSNVLDKTLFGMGEAYMMMHDCANAKLAYEACERRFAKEKIGAEAKARLATIAKNAPGTCAPQ